MFRHDSVMFRVLVVTHITTAIFNMISHIAVCLYINYQLDALIIIYS